MESRLGECDVASDIPQAKRTTDCADHQQVTTTVLIDQEDEVEDCEYSLDDTEETGGEERVRGTGDTDGFEDGWGVVVDSVDSRSVLPEEEGSTEEESPLD